jgi:hypothetical protein
MLLGPLIVTLTVAAAGGGAVKAAIKTPRTRAVRKVVVDMVSSFEVGSGVAGTAVRRLGRTIRSSA